MTLKKTTNKGAEAFIADRKPFRANSLSGYWMTEAPKNYGRLNSTDATYLDEEFSKGAVYVVWSYGTPIAYVQGSTVVVIEQRHSVTSSKHLNIARRALLGGN